MSPLKLLGIKSWKEFGRKKIAIFSGHFNPNCHMGHVQAIQAAKKLSDYLIVIVSNDAQIRLKGKNPYMTESHRMDFMRELRSVNEVVLAADKDTTVCETLKLIRKKNFNNTLTFYNSGDRTVKNLESKEVQLCEKLGIDYQIIDLPKIYSSSSLVCVRP